MSEPLHAVYELQAGHLGCEEIVVTSFRGQERISHPFVFDVDATTRHPPADLEAAVLGKRASLTMHVTGRPSRVVRGVVASMSRTVKPGAFGELGIRVRIVPRLWLLRRRHRSRIFQDQSIIDVVRFICSEYGIEAIVSRLKHTYEPQRYVVQYQETDYAFVRRLLAEQGIFFAFAQPQSPAPAPEQIILFDEASYPILDAAPALLFRDAEGLVHTHDYASSFSGNRRVRETDSFTRDFDFTKPSLHPSSSSTVAGPEPAAPCPILEFYDHHTDFLEPEAARNGAARILEQRRRRAVTCRGSSNCRQLTPGHRIALADHPDEPLNGAYAIIGVHHTGTTPEVGSRDVRVYENEFQCVPVEVPYRPRRPKRVVQQVSETATVVGPAGKEIHTDEHGRIKVQFHWDRDGLLDDRSSCWIRVVQGWAGASWGFQFIPRVGMEVLVTFLGGDTDRPVVVGCMYNAINPPSHGLPRNATKSGIRTRSTPGSDGFNELSFEDQRGQELVYLHAERDLSEVVKNDHRVMVGVFDPEKPYGDQKLDVAANQYITVGIDQNLEVKGRQQLTILGGKTEMISEGSLLRVEGLWEQRLDDGLEQHIAASHRHWVGGSFRSDVLGDARVTTGGNCQIRVDGNETLKVGRGMDISVHDGYSVNASQAASITSNETIRLVCGESSIEIRPKEIAIFSPTITLLAKELFAHAQDSIVHLEKGKATVASKEVVLSTKEAEITLGDDGLAAATKKDLTLYSKGASLVLDSDAKLDGSTVKLNCGDDSGGEYDEPDEIEASWIDLALTRKVPKAGDPTLLDDRPISGARYRVEAADGRVFTGALDGEGKARVPIPKGSAQVSFPEYDKGRLKAK